MNKLEIILVSLMATLATCSILLYGYKLIMYLYSMFGVLGVCVLICFIGVWSIWYIILDED